MARAASLWKWTYSAYDKMWHGSRGTGRFAVQYSRSTGKWYAMTAPFLFGTPTLLGEYSSLREAKDYIQSKY